MPSTPEQSHYFYTRTTFGKLAKFFTRKLCHAKRLWNLMQSYGPSVRLDWACYKCAPFIQNALDNIRQTELSCKQLGWFARCAVKKFWDFVQLLVGLLYSNIGYLIYFFPYLPLQGSVPLRWRHAILGHQFWSWYHWQGHVLPGWSKWFLCSKISPQSLVFLPASQLWIWS